MAFANFSLTTAYTAIITALNAQLTAVGGLFKDQTTGDFTGQVRVNSSGKRLESWNGSVWVAVDLSLTAIAAASIAAGTVTANLTGNVTGNVTGNLTGTASTATNCTAYTAADVLTKLLTVDGAGSMLDSDKLDGQDGSYYANPSMASSAEILTGTDNAKTITPSGLSGSGMVCRAFVNFDGTPTLDLATVAFTYSGATITATKTAHGLDVGRSITLSGGTGNNITLNGTWVVATVPTVDTFTFVVGGTPAGALSTQTVVPSRIRNSMGVTGVTRDSSAQFTVTLSKTMPNKCCAVVTGSKGTNVDSWVTSGNAMIPPEFFVLSTTTIKLYTHNAASNAADPALVTVAVFW